MPDSFPAKKHGQVVHGQSLPPDTESSKGAHQHQHQQQTHGEDCFRSHRRRDGRVEKHAGQSEFHHEVLQAPVFFQCQQLLFPGQSAQRYRRKNRHHNPRNRAPFLHKRSPLPFFFTVSYYRRKIQPGKGIYRYVSVRIRHNLEFSNVHSEQQCHFETVVKWCGSLSRPGVILSQ